MDGCSLNKLQGLSLVLQITHLLSSGRITLSILLCFTLSLYDYVIYTQPSLNFYATWVVSPPTTDRWPQIVFSFTSRKKKSTKPLLLPSLFPSLYLFFFFLHHSLPEGGKIPLLTLSQRFFSSSVRARISPQWRFWQDAGEKQVMKAPWKTTWITGLTNSLRRLFFPS